MTREDMTPSEQLDLKVLEEMEINPRFGYALLAANSLLEQEDFHAVIESLRPHISMDSGCKSSLLFLARFYFGQAIFRLEMKRSRPRTKKICQAIHNLQKSAAANPDYPDTQLMLAWASMIHYRIDPQNSDLSVAVRALHIVTRTGNPTHVKEAQRFLKILETPVSLQSENDVSL